MQRQRTSAPGPQGRSDRRTPALLAFLGRASLGWACLVGLGACGDADLSPVTITHTLAVGTPPDNVDPGADSDDRFLPFDAYLQRRQAEQQGERTSLADAITYDVPPTWVRIAPAQFRDLNFLVGEGGDVEAWLTFMPGNGGGALANLDRWRDQMGLGPARAEDLEALPRIDFFTSRAPFVELSAEGDAEDRPGMLGAFLDTPQGMLFAKLVGPWSRVQAERAHFRDFCSSLRLRLGDPPGDPHGHGDPSASAGGATGPFQPPAGWRQGPPRQMRFVTYEIGEGTECYVSGAGGNVRDNADRWRKQLGVGPLDDAAYAALERVPFADHEAVLVEARGSYTGMDGSAIPEAALLGAMVELEGESLFVKMVGPAAEVEGARAGFFELLAFLAENAPR